MDRFSVGQHQSGQRISTSLFPLDTQWHKWRVDSISTRKSRSTLSSSIIHATLAIVWPKKEKIISLQPHTNGFSAEKNEFNTVWCSADDRLLFSIPGSSMSGSLPPHCSDHYTIQADCHTLGLKIRQARAQKLSFAQWRQWQLDDVNSERHFSFSRAISLSLERDTLSQKFRN